MYMSPAKCSLRCELSLKDDVLSGSRVSSESPISGWGEVWLCEFLRH